MTSRFTIHVSILKFYSLQTKFVSENVASSFGKIEFFIPDPTQHAVPCDSIHCMHEIVWDHMVSCTHLHRTMRQFIQTLLGIPAI